MMILLFGQMDICLKELNLDYDNEVLITATVDPDEPKCIEGNSHDWDCPFEIVGGIKENPGVWGNAGGVIINEVCMNCGRGKRTNTWAQRRDNGEQGLTSVEYEEKFYIDDLEEYLSNTD